MTLGVGPFLVFTIYWANDASPATIHHLSTVDAGIEMARNNMKILGQGHLDGACFLYAIANAQKCLSDRQNTAVPAKRWGEMISLLNAADFLDLGIGTQRTDDNAELQEQLALQCISKLDPKATFAVKTIKELGATSRFDQHVTNQSVILLPTQEHWYCLVDSQDKVAYLACSSHWQEAGEKYQEAVSPRLKRVYNKAIEFKDLKIFQNRAIVFSVKSKSPTGKDRK
jgi:hypothetical protein